MLRTYTASRTSVGRSLPTTTVQVRSLFTATAGLLRFKPQMFEAPLDKQVESTPKGPPVAHSLPVYKKAAKLHSSARWKKANISTNVVSGKDFRLRETHGEGIVDETGIYRDWLYGEERRFANYLGLTLGFVSLSLFYYTMRSMSNETWDLPAPLMSKPPEIASSRKDGSVSPGSAGGAPFVPPSTAGKPTAPRTQGNATLVQ